MKILGIGVPELLVLLVIALVVVLIVLLVNSSKKNGGQPAAPNPPAEGLQQQTPAMTPQDLERYAELYKSGALSQEEFEAIKNRFLHS